MSKRRLVQNIASGVVIILFALALGLVVDFIRFPEYYIPTWKHALECGLQRGDELAIEYYENTYIANGRTLFE